MGLIPVSGKCTHQGVPSCADSSDLSIVRTCHADSCEWLTSMIQWEAHMAPLLPASLNGLVTGCVSAVLLRENGILSLKCHFRIDVRLAST